MTTASRAGIEGINQSGSMIFETWHSTALKTSLITKATSPMVEFTSKLSNIRLLEPDPVLFQVPPDYAIVDEKGPFTIQYGRQP